MGSNTEWVPINLDGLELVIATQRVTQHRVADTDDDDPLECVVCGCRIEPLTDHPGRWVHAIWCECAPRDHGARAALNQETRP